MKQIRARCSRSEDADRPRRIRVNPTLNAFRGRASEMLRSEAGSALRKRCSVDVETAFGNIKRNLGFTRFTLGGAREGGARVEAGRHGPQHTQALPRGIEEGGGGGAGVGPAPALFHFRGGRGRRGIPGMEEGLHQNRFRYSPLRSCLRYVAVEEAGEGAGHGEDVGGGWVARAAGELKRLVDVGAKADCGDKPVDRLRARAAQRSHARTRTRADDQVPRAERDASAPDRVPLVAICLKVEQRVARRVGRVGVGHGDSVHARMLFQGARTPRALKHVDVMGGRRIGW
ncbi:transposase [Collinsella tanakaei]|nr:transposase [Collinsella tanakaei]